MSPVWFGSEPQSARHRFLLKATKPVIWPRGDDDLAMSERIPTSVELGHFSQRSYPQITERQGTAMFNPILTPTNVPFVPSQCHFRFNQFISDFCRASIIASLDLPQPPSADPRNPQWAFQGCDRPKNSFSKQKKDICCVSSKQPALMPHRQADWKPAALSCLKISVHQPTRARLPGGRMGCLPPALASLQSHLFCSGSDPRRLLPSDL